MPDRPKEPEPEQGVPPGETLGHEWVCRYCDRVFATAEEVATHQDARHLGVGMMRVTDELPDG